MILPLVIICHMKLIFTNNYQQNVFNNFIDDTVIVMQRKDLILWVNKTQKKSWRYSRLGNKKIPTEPSAMADYN